MRQFGERKAREGGGRRKENRYQARKFVPPHRWEEGRVGDEKKEERRRIEE